MKGVFPRKVTISLPEELAAAIEDLRRRQGVSRSHLVQRAIAHALEEAEKARAIRRYEAGYRKRPEAPEARAFTEAAVRVLGKERWA